MVAEGHGGAARHRAAAGNRDGARCAVADFQIPDGGQGGAGPGHRHRVIEDEVGGAGETAAGDTDVTAANIAGAADLQGSP